MVSVDECNSLVRFELVVIRGPSHQSSKGPNSQAICGLESYIICGLCPRGFVTEAAGSTARLSLTGVLQLDELTHCSCRLGGPLVHKGGEVAEVTVEGCHTLMWVRHAVLQEDHGAAVPVVDFVAGGMVIHEQVPQAITNLSQYVPTQQSAVEEQSTSPSLTAATTAAVVPSALRLQQLPGGGARLWDAERIAHAGPGAVGAAAAAHGAATKWSRDSRGRSDEHQAAHAQCCYVEGGSSGRGSLVGPAACLRASSAASLARYSSVYC